MSEERAYALITIACLVFVAIGVLGLAALGVRGVGLSLGALIPLILSAEAISRMVMHYGEIRRREHK